MVTVAVAVGLALLIQAFLVKPYRVPTGSMLPTLAIIGLRWGWMMSSTVLVETVFDWPGIGQQLYQAISARDEPLIEAGVLFTAVALVLTNVLVDTIHAYVDPRVRA